MAVRPIMRRPARKAGLICGLQPKNYRIRARARRRRSTVSCGAGPAARILIPSSNATNGAIRATRREAGVNGFDCGAGGTSTGVTPPPWWVRPYPVCARHPLPARLPIQGREGFKPMTQSDNDQAARRRSALARDRGARRLSLAINARRRLSASAGDKTGPKAQRRFSSDTVAVAHVAAQPPRPTDALLRGTRSANAPS